MQTVLRVVAASEVALVILERFLPIPGILPLGGSHLAQIGILFGLPFVGFEWMDAIRKWWGK
jgi:hypothetical protein